VRNPDGSLVERSVRQLSGGERRRLALALALGFAGLTASRGNLRCNVIVLDEARRTLLLTHTVLRLEASFCNAMIGLMDAAAGVQQAS